MYLKLRGLSSRGNDRSTQLNGTDFSVNTEKLTHLKRTRIFGALIFMKRLFSVMG